MAKFTWIITDDWQGLYKDGKLLMEGHSLHPVYFSKELGIELSNYDEDIDEYLYENGSLPENITDLPGFGYSSKDLDDFRDYAVWNPEEDENYIKYEKAMNEIYSNKILYNLLRALKVI